MNKFVGLYEVRDYKPEDRNFVLATFLRGLYYGDPWYQEIPKDIFMGNYKYVAEALVDSKSVIIKIACTKDDQDVIIGYSMLSTDFTVVHWVFVKERWRGRGIGSSLVPAYFTAASHLSSLGRALIKKYKDAIFNPFAIS